MGDAVVAGVGAGSEPGLARVSVRAACGRRSAAADGGRQACQQGVPVGHEAAVVPAVAFGDPRVERLALRAVVADVAQYGEAQALVHQHLQPLPGHAGAQLEEVCRKALHRNGDPLGLVPEGIVDQVAQGVAIQLGACIGAAQDAGAADLFEMGVHGAL